MRRQNLDRCVAVDVSLIAFIDGRHTALAQQVDNFILAEHLPDN
jgi:hypothetical protein